MTKRRVPCWQETGVIEAVRRNGNDANDLRDAAHEAAHALQLGVPRGRWERDHIHDRLCTKARETAHHKLAREDSDVMDQLKLSYDFLWKSEIYARAVEQIVCRTLSVRTEPVEVWAKNAYMEAAMMSIKGPTLEQVVRRIHAAMKTKTAKHLVDRVIGLAVNR